jgi:hypothetical protein
MGLTTLALTLDAAGRGGRPTPAFHYLRQHLETLTELGFAWRLYCSVLLFRSFVGANRGR